MSSETRPLGSILIVDDVEGIREILSLSLTTRGYETLAASNIDDACHILATRDIDVVLSDIYMPPYGALDTLRRLRDTPTSARIILMTAFPELNTALAALRMQVFDYLEKPFTNEHLLETVEHAVQLKRAEAQALVRQRQEHEYLDYLEKLVAQRGAELHQTGERVDDTIFRFRRAQSEPLKEQSLRLLAQMISGISHDFNNVLMPIIGLSEFLIANPVVRSNPRELLRTLEIIQSAARDARDIVWRLRWFYRPEESHTAMVRIYDFLQDVAAMTKPKWESQSHAQGGPIRVVFDCVPSLTVAANGAELRELLINLIFNAVDAMAAGGTLTLSGKEEDGRVVLRVTDTGCGMDAATLGRCMDPGFTTKGSAGSGLGLAMCYGIARAHDAEFTMDSQPGRGTCVTLRFPPSESRLAARAADGAADVPTGERSTSLRILVVDDDMRTRVFLHHTLEHAGHQVQECATAEDAIALLGAGSTFDLIVTDHAMPGMSGAQFVEYLRKNNNTTAVIMLTGASEPADNAELMSRIDSLLVKPVTTAEIIHTVTTVARKHQVTPPKTTKHTCG